MRLLFLHFLLCYANAELPVSKKKNLTSKVVKETAFLAEKLSTAQKRLSPTPLYMRKELPKYNPEQEPLLPKYPDHLPPPDWLMGADLSKDAVEGSGVRGQTGLDYLPGEADDEDAWIGDDRGSEVSGGSGYGPDYYSNHLPIDFGSFGKPFPENGEVLDLQSDIVETNKNQHSTSHTTTVTTSMPSHEVVTKPGSPASRTHLDTFVTVLSVLLWLLFQLS